MELVKHKDVMAKVLSTILDNVILGWEGDEELYLRDYEIVDFKPFKENCKSEEDYKAHINGTVNANFLGYNVNDGNVYAMHGKFYDPDEWEFYVWDYQPNKGVPEIEEPLHIAAYNLKTRRLDILHMTYTAPDNWFVEKSTFLSFK